MWKFPQLTCNLFFSISSRISTDIHTNSLKGLKPTSHDTKTVYMTHLKEVLTKGNQFNISVFLQNLEDFFYLRTWSHKWYMRAMILFRWNEKKMCGHGQRYIYFRLSVTKNQNKIQYNYVSILITTVFIMCYHTFCIISIWSGISFVISYVSASYKFKATIRLRFGDGCISSRAARNLK